MKISYLVTFILLLITSSLIPIKDRKTNLGFRILLEIILIMAFNVLTTIILFYLKIPANLSVFSILYGIMCVINCIFIWKRKKIQKYKIKKIDIIFYWIGLVILIVVFLCNYGYPAEIKYISVDASTHFSAAFNFMEKEQLLIGDTSSVSRYFGLDWLLIGAYVNTGLLMSLCEGLIGEIQLYILFDLFILWGSIIVTYEVMKKICRSKYKRSIAAVLSIFYVLAYPLNSVLIGSTYLTLALLIIMCIYWLYLEKETFHPKTFRVILTLLNIFLMHSYILFAIIVLMAELIYFIYTERKRSWKSILLTILVPSITLILYIHKTPERIGGIAGEGPMYRNYYSNFLIYIPFAIGAIWYDIKNKKWSNPENLFFVLSIVTILTTLILKEFKVISSYYFFKYYYVFWGILILEAAKGICIFMQKKNKMAKFVLSFVLIVYIVSFFWIDIHISTDEIAVDVSKEKITSFAEIFRINYNWIFQGNTILNSEEIKLIEKVNKEKKINEEIPLIGAFSQINWYYAIINEAYDESNHERVVEKLYNSENWRTERILVLKRSSVMYSIKENILKKYQYSYEEKYGGLLTKREK